MLLWILSLAFAGPTTLPKQSTTLFAGVGASYWKWGMSGQRRDPATIGRIDLYAARGLTDRFEVAASLPLVSSRILKDDPELAPCPRADAFADEDYCDPVTGLGRAALLVRASTPTSPVGASVGLGIAGDPWNASTRTRYINVGQGVFAGLLTGSVGGSHGKVSWSASGRYTANAGRPVPGHDFRAPADNLWAELAPAVTLGTVSLRPALSHTRQLAGVPYTGTYLQELYPTPERWGVIAFAQTRAEAKVSIGIGDVSGVHVTASRAIATVDGPKDHTDISVGVHRWIDGAR